ncbi:ATP-dependent helicase [Saccharicrinis sp. FJH54]|uniref:ATP-dependent helicase n=1 Tax=Saccharicrinis sp. FJH54 TaxID=3344665 RepID=UPI0035D4B9D7
MKDFLNELNSAQKDAVVNTDGPSLVLAGAGSGKTRVLTYRIANLLDKGIHPGSVLALTFTNKAAREMKDRIARIAGYQVARYLWMGTFHSVFSRILRKESELLGFPATFTIYDTADSKSLIKTIIKELKLDDKVYKPGYVQSRISLAKNNLITPASYESNAQLVQTDGMNKMPQISLIYKIYANRCKRAGAMDFDDLLLFTNILFRDHPEALAKYQDQFRYVLVDEYQDTNMAQYLIIKKLSEKHRNICVVGDDAQSIYSFRGAKVDNILRFPKDFPGCKVYKLEQNYRSTQTIVLAANSLIDKNKEQYKKNIFSENDAGSKINFINAYSDVEEGVLVVNRLNELRLRDHFDYQDFAILYRTNAQSRVFEEALRKRNVPYKIYGGLSFYQRKEIKDLLAYFRLIINPADDEALKRVINFPARGIGKTTLDKLTDLVALNQEPMLKVCLDPLRYNLNVNSGTANKLIRFGNLIVQMRTVAEEGNAYELAYEVAHKSGLVKELKSDNSPESVSRLENIEELLNAIRDFTDSAREEGTTDSMEYFLQEVSLLTDQDSEKEEDRNKVTLMTVHASKGLEFKNVFVTGLEEELFPSARAMDNPKDMEEERRLFYVAVTRAEVNCTVSYAKSRYRYGTPVFCKPSRFLKDIDLEYYDNPQSVSLLLGNGSLGSARAGKANFVNRRKTESAVGARFRKPENKTPVRDAADFKADPVDKIRSGDMVEHIRFGKGTVVSLQGEKAVVDFETAGKKTLLLKFARLKIL